MNTQQYKSWLDNITNISNEMDITSTIGKYPYCMLFRLYKALQTKSAENKSIVAILHPDRKHLSEFFIEKKKDKKETAESTPKAKTKPKIVHETDVKPKVVVKKQEVAPKKEITETTQVQEKDDLMQILQQRLAELSKESFSVKGTKEVEVKEEVLYEPKPSVSLDELVEKFNKFPPSVSYNPTDFEDEENYKDLGKSSLQEKTNIVSETLAELYTNQGAYDKAIKIYEALMVKYPEKNATFAKLIESLKDKKKS